MEVNDVPNNIRKQKRQTVTMDVCLFPFIHGLSCQFCEMCTSICGNGKLIPLLGSTVYISSLSL